MEDDDDDDDDDDDGGGGGDGGGGNGAGGNAAAEGKTAAAECSSVAVAAAASDGALCVPPTVAVATAAIPAVERRALTAKQEASLVSLDAMTDYLDDLSCSDLCAAPRAVGLTGPVPLHLAVARPRSLPYAVSEPRFETSLDLMGIADDMWVPSMVGIQNSALMGTGICNATAAVVQRLWGAASAAFDVSSLGVTLSQQAPSPLWRATSRRTARWACCRLIRSASRSRTCMI